MITDRTVASRAAACRQAVEVARDARRGTREGGRAARRAVRPRHVRRAASGPYGNSAGTRSASIGALTNERAHAAQVSPQGLLRTYLRTLFAVLHISYITPYLCHRRLREL